MQRLTIFLKKHKSILLYAIFGVLTTIVNYLVYFPLYYFAEFSAALSNILAWLAAVLFAFVTNKAYVFRSNSWTVHTLLYEVTTFCFCRALTGALETVALLVMVDYMGMDSMVCKLVVSFAIVVINYVGSKLFVFRDK